MISPGRLVSSAARLPLQFKPGSRASYSNTNYLVLAEILRRVTRQPLGRLMRDRIFVPLELDATTYRPARRTLEDDQVHGYDVSLLPPTDVSLHGFGGPWADGAIVSNAPDLAVFFGALLRGELVPPRFVAEMEKIVPRSHGEGLGLYRLRSPCGLWSTGTRAARPDTSPSPPACVTEAACSCSPGTASARRRSLRWTRMSTTFSAATESRGRPPKTRKLGWEAG